MTNNRKSVNITINCDSAEFYEKNGTTYVTFSVVGKPPNGAKKKII